ncbi:MAG: DUF2169 domain-containing protein [Granulosicoccus sp.]|nr:DUF2169 domain-containing protein [Granulosicoccus sp.]
MELINNTAVATNLLVAESADPERRAVLGTAKATFVVAENGQVKLDKNDPMPVYTKDVETRYGILPREDIPRLDPAFEVMVLGNAYAPGGRAVQESRVSLQVGHVEQSLIVHGDRHWEGQGADARIGAAEPFTRLPLRWDRAFGGTQEVEIDEDSFVDVTDPVNAEGKGFNYQPQVDELAAALKCPAGYPRFKLPRPLPNIESPAAPIAKPDDSPLPVCWAPCMGSSGIIVERIRRAQKAAGDDAELQAQAVTLGSPLMLHRAHPDWVIEAPVAEASVRLEGMTKSGVMEFVLPPVRVVLDVAIAGEERALELHPNTMMLFPDLNKFTLTFRGTLPYRYRPEDQRTARVRLDKGWKPAPRSAAQNRRTP